MAKLKASLERGEWAKLTPEVQSFYIERSGKYVLDSDDAEELRNALDRTKEQLREIKERMAAVEDVDPQEYKRLQEEAAQLKRQGDLDAGNYAKVRDEDRAKYTKEVELRDLRIKRLESSLEGALIDAEATREIAAHGGNPKLLLPAMRPNIAIRELGGRHIAVVLNDKGEPKLRAGAKNADDYQPIGEYVAEMKTDKEYAGAFKGSGGSGSHVPLVNPYDPQTRTVAATVDGIVQQLKSGATTLTS